MTGRGASSDKATKHWGDSFFDISRKAAEQWTFPAPPYAGCTVLVPVLFRMPVKGWVLARTLPADPALVRGDGCAHRMGADGRPETRRFVLRTPLPGLLPGRPD